MQGSIGEGKDTAVPTPIKRPPARPVTTTPPNSFTAWSDRVLTQPELPLVQVVNTPIEEPSIEPIATAKPVKRTTAAKPKKTNVQPEPPAPVDTLENPGMALHRGARRRRERVVAKVQQLYSDRAKANLQDIRNKKFSKKALEKATEHALADGFETFDDYFEQVVSKSSGLQSLYAKDPKRQNLVEPYIQELWRDNYGDLIPHVQALPKGGENAVRLVLLQDGSLVAMQSKVAKHQRQIGKTIDFISITDDAVYLFAHKFTEESGGGQDNQREDLYNLIDNIDGPISSIIPGTQGRKVHIIAVGDGPYWNGHRMDVLATKSRDARDRGASVWGTNSNSLGALLTNPKHGFKPVAEQN